MILNRNTETLFNKLFEIKEKLKFKHKLMYLICATFLKELPSFFPYLSGASGKNIVSFATSYSPLTSVIPRNLPRCHKTRSHVEVLVNLRVLWCTHAGLFPVAKNVADRRVLFAMRLSVYAAPRREKPCLCGAFCKKAGDTFFKIH